MILKRVNFYIKCAPPRPVTFPVDNYFICAVKGH